MFLPNVRQCSCVTGIIGDYKTNCESSFEMYNDVLDDARILLSWTKKYMGVGGQNIEYIS